jgi:F-type H+-transporting ATPase subunit delta
MSRIANRYSKALFQLAREEGKEDQVLADLQHIADVIKASFALQDLLNNPIIRGDLKATSLMKVFKNHIDELTARFLILLCRKRRSNQLLEVIRQYENDVYTFKGIIKSTIISAVKLEKEQVEKIISRISDLTGKTIILAQEVDRHLIGGFIIKLEDTLIDLSIRGQLERLRKQLIYGEVK